MNDDTKKITDEELDNFIARKERSKKVSTACEIGSVITDTAGSMAAATIIATLINSITGIKHVNLLRFGGCCLGWIIGTALYEPNKVMWSEIEDSINLICDLYDDYKKSKAKGISFKEYVKIKSPNLVKEA